MKHYCCAVTFKATPVLRELVNTSKVKHGFIPILCCLNVIALKHRYQRGYRGDRMGHKPLVMIGGEVVIG